MILSGCGKSEAPVQQQAYQQIPRLSAEDENLIFGNATRVDIYEQLSVGSSDLLEASEDPMPEESTAGDADSFFADQKPVIGDQAPLFGDQTPVIGAPVLGEPDSIPSYKNLFGETPLTEKEPLGGSSDDPAELGSLDTKP